MSARSQNVHRQFTYPAAKALIILLFALFVVMLVGSLWRGWADAERRGEERALSGAHVVSTNARWISELARSALLRIDDALGEDLVGNAADTEALIREAVANLPGEVKAYVIATDGQTLFSTDPNLQPIDVRDRPYFQALADGAVWYLSPLLVSRLDGEQIFVYSRRLVRNGTFAGAAVISFNVEMLQSIFEALGDPDAAVAFVRDDGQLVARYPLASGPLDLSEHILFTEGLATAEEGTITTTSPSDGQVRIVGFERVPGTEIIAAAAIDRASAFAPFRTNAAITLFFAVPTAFLLAAAIVWIFRLLSNDQARQRSLREANEVNKMLVRDTHHRVKNNLQAIMSMVRMHALPDELKLDLQSRIAAMSAVHEHLYRLDQFSEVRAATLIPGIVDPIKAGYGSGVEVSYDIADLQVDHDQATPLALLISELATNVFKYAFPDGAPGRLSIRLAPSGENGAKLVVADDGVGLQKGSGAGLGGKLIRAMLIQLGGRGSYADGPGTVFEAELGMGFKPAMAAPEDA